MDANPGSAQRLPAAGAEAALSEFPRAALEQSIPAVFEGVLSRHGKRIAVKSRHSALTYEELDRGADQLARALLARLGIRPEPVALLFEHDISAVVAIMAVLKAGKTYVPLDPRAGKARLAAVLDDVEPRALLTGGSQLELAREVIFPGTAIIDSGDVGSGAMAGDEPLPIASPAPAVLCYTSGSTGQPKGVVSGHREILHRVLVFANTVRLRPDDRLSLLFALSVSASLRTLFGALLTGATVCLYDVAREGLAALAGWLGEERITICQCAPSVFRQFARAMPGPGGLPALRVLWLGSEPVLVGDVDLYRAHLADDCLLINGLSSGETGGVCQFAMDKTTPIAGTLVPAGRAVADKEVLVLDDDGRDVGVDQIGEIVVRSEYLAEGYWRRPALTAAVFLPDPAGGRARLYRTGDLGRRLPDGMIVHVGRKDAVPKLRGRFVDVATIEAALLQRAAIQDAAVAVREDEPGEARLIAYLVPTQVPGPKVSALRRDLLETLSPGMVPAVFVYLEALPRTPNGKLDRRALPAPGRRRPSLENPYAPPRNPIEETLARLWAEVLQVDEIGIHDGFLELGGDSLRATRVIAHVRELFRVDLPISTALDAATVADMAAIVERLLPVH
jgi:amino acid adenylation domain-containing protein